MAGTVKGKIDCFFSGGTALINSRDIFIAIYKHLNNLVVSGYTELVALQTNGGAVPMVFSDEVGAVPGDNSFYVFRFLPFGTRTWSWYILVQWSYGATFGNAPGNPGLANNDNGTASNGDIGIACAVALTSLGADANPWAGTVLGNGTDTKAATVWAAPALGSLYVFPRSNNPGGDHNTNKENTSCCVLNTGTGNMRAHIIGDRDNLFVAWNTSDAGNYRWMHQGLYTRVTGLPTDIPNFFQFGLHSGMLFSNTFFGLIDGSSAGGVLSPRTNQVQQAMYGALVQDTSTTEPNPQYAATTFSRQAIPLYIDEFPLTPPGKVGEAEFLTQTLNCASDSTFDTLAKIVIGSSTTTERRLAVPWDGASTPKTSLAKAGIDF
jgi:hypothetical protein